MSSIRLATEAGHSYAANACPPQKFLVGVMNTSQNDAS